MYTTILKTGYYAALIAFVAALGYCVVQLLQVGGILHFPWDDILIFGFSLCIATPFMVALVCLYNVSPYEKKIWSHLAMIFGVIYAAYATFVYAIQLGVVVPKEIRGENESIQFMMMNPHSFSWTIDALTYICLGVATLFGAFAFARTGFPRYVRYFFLANACITPLIAIVYFYPEFSTRLLMLGLPWVITAPGSMLLLAIHFRRLLHSSGAIPIEAKQTLTVVRKEEEEILG